MPTTQGWRPERWVVSRRAQRPEHREPKQPLPGRSGPGLFPSGVPERRDLLVFLGCGASLVSFQGQLNRQLDTLDLLAVVSQYNPVPLSRGLFQARPPAYPPHRLSWWNSGSRARRALLRGAAALYRRGPVGCVAFRTPVHFTAAFPRQDRITPKRVPRGGRAPERCAEGSRRDELAGMLLCSGFEALDRELTSACARAERRPQRRPLSTYGRSSASAAVRHQPAAGRTGRGSYRTPFGLWCGKSRLQGDAAARETMDLSHHRSTQPTACCGGRGRPDEREYLGTTFRRNLSAASGGMTRSRD